MLSEACKIHRIIETFGAMDREDMTTLELSISEIVTGVIATQEDLCSAENNTKLAVEAIMNCRLGSG